MSMIRAVCPFFIMDAARASCSSRASPAASMSALRASLRPVRACSTSYTIPLPPWPIGRTTLYRPSITVPGAISSISFESSLGMAGFRGTGAG